MGRWILFFGNDGLTIPSRKYGLFRTDGTASGTVRVTSQVFETPYFFSISLGDRAVFWGVTAAEGHELWVTDGTARGTFLLADLSPGKESTTLYGGIPLGRRKALFVVYTGDLVTRYGLDGWPGRVLDGHLPHAPGTYRTVLVGDGCLSFLPPEEVPSF